MNPDSDADGLLDGVEVIGWPITVNGETYTAHSNPLKIDTDNDGLTPKNPIPMGMGGVISSSRGRPPRSIQMGMD
ncbi:MAG: hypothetical protein ACTSQI_20260 [Candidatus Helarchaeota archaeon]